VQRAGEVLTLSIAMEPKLRSRVAAVYSCLTMNDVFYLSEP
jgi:hypothetical protein